MTLPYRVLFKGGLPLKDLRRARRVGACAILSALILRFFAGGGAEWVEAVLKKENTDFTETGQDVRFSPSLEVFVPDFVESPPASVPKPTEPPLPSFSGNENISVYYGADVEVDIRALLAAPLRWELADGRPAVLILHTHTTESYTKQGEAYVETSAWRTLDEGYNMVSIGDRVGEILQENGIGVVHHRELNDYPSYNGSYTRARSTIREYLEQYPSIALVLDLHRDASGGEGSQMRTRARVDGEASAQLMVVIGTNHEHYEENLSFGAKLHAQLEELAPGIMRPLQLRSQRFNQDLCTGALIVEVGAAGNTHAEALTAAEALAKAIVQLSRGTG